MWIVTALIFFLVVMLTLLFVLPLELVLKSDKNFYCFRIPYFFSIRVIPKDSLVSIKGWVLFIPFSFGVDDLFKEEKDQNWTLRRGIKLGRVGLKIRNAKHLAGNILKAIRIHHIYATFDTGNYPLNAKLIPIASVLQTNNIAMQVNFVNRNWIDVLIYTRLYKLTWVLLKHLRTKF